jgi:hypothetical protein
VRLTANEVRGQTLRRFKSSRLRQKMAPPLWVGPFLLRRVVRIWEELAPASDGSSRLRSRMRDRWRSLAFGMAINGVPFHPHPFGWGFLSIRNWTSEDLGRACASKRWLSRLRQKMAPPVWVGPFLLRRAKPLHQPQETERDHRT